jgi:hypothetical protein
MPNLSKFILIKMSYKIIKIFYLMLMYNTHWIKAGYDFKVILHKYLFSKILSYMLKLLFSYLWSYIQNAVISRMNVQYSMTCIRHSVNAHYTSMYYKYKKWGSTYANFFSVQALYQLTYSDMKTTLCFFFDSIFLVSLQILSMQLSKILVPAWYAQCWSGADSCFCCCL